MLSLNLLSPTEKIDVSKIRLFIILKSITFSIVSILLICGVVFGFSYYLLSNNSSSLSAQIEAERVFQQEKNISSTEDAVKILNNYLATAIVIQQEYVPWTRVLSQFSESIPADITLTSIDFSTINQSCTISGIARNRTALLTFQDQLNSVPFLTNVNSPLSNYTQPENIAFGITATLNETIHQ